MERLRAPGVRSLTLLIASIGVTATVASTMSTEHHVAQDNRPSSVRVYRVADLAVWEPAANGELQFAPDVLISLIRATTSPGTSQQEIRPFAKNASLVISQTDANHERVARLLDELRTAEPGETHRR